MSVLRLFGFVLLACSLHAEELPKIGASERVLSAQDVKNYWLNAIPKLPLPDQGNGLNPEQQQKRQSVVAERKSLMKAIRDGQHDTDARLVSLEHNVGAWTKLGDDKKAMESEQHLLALKKQLAAIAALEAQRDLAKKMSLTVDRIAALESEISSLRQELSNQACNNSCE